MGEIILDTLIDSIKILPFLFLAFLIMEYVEHKLGNKSNEIIKKSGKLGPLFGGILGGFPQCGFSVAATNLYAGKVITVGTLIAIYLSTTDEMLPILLSRGVSLDIILKIILINVVIGILVGFIMDLFFKSKKTDSDIEEFCEREHCHCEDNILLSSLKHTLNIFIFIVVISFVLNSLVHYLGLENISKIFLSNTIFGPFVASLIGLIPNCVSSVVITELYLGGAISFGSMIAGVLTGSGVALMLLFRVNKNLKENIGIITMLYSIGAFFGILLDIFNMSI